MSNFMANQGKQRPPGLSALLDLRGLDLMDAAYDARPIYETSRSLGHVPIIDKNSRGKEVIPMAPHEATRYNERTAVERFNSRMKESFGAGNVMVRGAQKVKMHLMFGVIALFADQLLKLAV